MRAVLAAALALLACAPGYTNGTTGRSDANFFGGAGGTGGDGGRLDGGDGGTDGGDAGFDGGCAPLTLNGVPAFDNCHGEISSTATGTVNTTNCSLDLQLPSFNAACSGLVSGANDAFDGGCEGGSMICTSSSLPGTLRCAFAGGSCFVTICDAGAACP